MEPIEHMAGNSQKIVLSISDDRGARLDPGSIFELIAANAATAEARGGRIVSTAMMPLRQMGIAGNIFFQSGGQSATQAAVAVVYART